ncbi:unnamed protein product [Chrysodeixis includens]|uniref:Cuticle protein n=1 Tax=Chrysodeixis includens TaxID=689277 RepID=A0A9N8KVW2_CHRIL|nr:unnamed protein product [Chrysodeixis includens]
MEIISSPQLTSLERTLAGPPRMRGACATIGNLVKDARAHAGKMAAVCRAHSHEQLAEGSSRVDSTSCHQDEASAPATTINAVSINLRLVVLSCLLAIAHGSAVPAIAAPVAYAAPAPVAARIEQIDPFPQYNFGYNVADSLTGDYKSQNEQRNGDLVQGQYSLVDPDGTRRVVDYTADSVNGFNAVVRKEPLVAAAPAVVAEPAVVPARYAAAPVAAAPIVAQPAVAAPVVTAARYAVAPTYARYAAAPVAAAVAAPVAAPAPVYARYAAAPVAAPVVAARYAAAPVAAAPVAAAPAFARYAAAPVVAARYAAPVAAYSAAYTTPYAAYSAPFAAYSAPVAAAYTSPYTFAAYSAPVAAAYRAPVAAAYAAPAPTAAAPAPVTTVRAAPAKIVEANDAGYRYP